MPLAPQSPSILTACFGSSFAAWAACFSSLLDFCPLLSSICFCWYRDDFTFRRLSVWCKDSYRMSGHVLTTWSQGLWWDVLTFASSSSATGNFSPCIPVPAGLRVQSHWYHVTAPNEQNLVFNLFIILYHAQAAKISRSSIVPAADHPPWNSEGSRSQHQ